MRTVLFRGLALVFMISLVLSPNLSAQESGGTVILDTTGFWRLYQVFKPPVVQTDSGLEKVLATKQPWLHGETPPPPEGWEKPDFDDSRWLRGPARIACSTHMLARLCLRGKFMVTNPASVRGLALTVGYYGGAIVYVNGKEIKRGHLKEGEEGKKGLAETYPEEAYFFGTIGWKYRDKIEPEKAKIRTRVFSQIPIPSKLLRKGVNVIAIEIIRAPEHKSVKGIKGKRGAQQKTLVVLNWATCAIRYARLTTAGTQGIIQNAVRPQGFQIWNSNLLASDFAVDFADSTEKLRLIKIIGARNGSFSGKVVVGSGKVVHGLKAAISDLKSSGATIPASAVRIRYGIPWGKESGAKSRYPAGPVLLGALAESPLQEIPVRRPKRSRYYNLKTPNQLSVVYGAVVSVWVTVDVPADARAGTYEGTLTIEAKGEKPVKVAVKLGVEDWKLPDPDNYHTWVELTQSPDTLVEEYGLKRWSDKHFEMIAKSMKHLNRIGSRVLYIPVICHTNIGNEESMVRWIKKGEYEYDWDLSIMDKYLSVAEKHMGKPKVVCFWVWEKFMFPTPEDPKTFEQYRPGKRVARTANGSAEYIGKGPKVSVLDPATGKMEKQHLPYLLDPKSKAVWKPLFVKLRQKMKKRGLEKTMMLGTPSDVVLRNEHFAFFNELAPGLTWVSHSHMDLTKLYEAGGAELGYYTAVFGKNFYCGSPEDGRFYGWKQPHVHLLRNWHQQTDVFPLTTFRHMAESNITGNQRGIGHLGADFWNVIKDKRGRRKGRIYMKYPESNWRSNDICTSFLAPGPDGPVATIRYEVMREGVQECEARIFMEKALLSKKISGSLAKRCQEALDERVHYMIKGVSNLKVDGYIAGKSAWYNTMWWYKCGIGGNIWFITSGWEERTQKLYRLAGEVAKKTGYK